MGFVLVILPGFLFAYEAHDDLEESRNGRDTCRSATCADLSLIVVFLMIALPMYFTLNEARLPVQRVSGSLRRRASCDPILGAAAILKMSSSALGDTS